MLGFALRALVFQIIEVFDFSVGYNGKFEIFEKKSLTIRKSKFQNSQMSFLMTSGRKIQDKFENFLV